MTGRSFIIVVPWNTSVYLFRIWWILTRSPLTVAGWLLLNSLITPAKIDSTICISMDYLEATE